jgi:dihydropteroate synthase
MTEALLAQRPIVMGILNVTVDSFSDGGAFLEVSAALAHAREMCAAGADIIDVGGESTRPGAERVPVEVEQQRVLPVIRELAAEGVALSIDTLNASTAAEAVRAGARFINDVSGGLADADMARVAAESGATYIAGHWRGTSATMNEFANYDSVVDDVRNELRLRVDALSEAGLPRERIVFDPGLGFAKNAEQNWELLAQLSTLVGDGFPILVGASRKRFIGELLPTEANMVERDVPSAVVAALAVNAGAWGVRVHDVRMTKLALAAQQKWENAR